MERKRTGELKGEMAERVGFEPTWELLTPNSISSRARYGRTSLPLRTRLRYCAAGEFVFLEKRGGKGKKNPLLFAPGAEEGPQQIAAFLFQYPGYDGKPVVQKGQGGAGKIA